MVVKSMGKLDGSNDHFMISSDSVHLIYSDTSGMLSFSFDQQFVRYKDPETDYTSPDDFFLISGTLDGETKGSIVFNAGFESDSALNNSMGCSWLRAGILNVSIRYFQYPAYVYFPDADSCENQCLISINEDPFPYPIDE